ncbi:hypothetical protein MOE48_00440 [Bacillus inaquosorum]|uniref:hypothetical protein n=1 Tax=Bacillus inaquosorum TaxID=483913 RepID=UPI002281DEB4|nr:hypothetical protein [Bacillus inaquosorum]MCY9015003.1 hypothetical protein [Bacillus inaquosorum]MCY9028295.1 hypothetical protein [Bacillus inaquosorum]MCY9039795.1 hypothetical protein [Bacillus inaquosorum]MCY9120781.1 hypothetical protein [Bacillus inaquosorum]
MNSKNKIYYERGTEELRKQNIRAHKLVREFNYAEPEKFEKRKKSLDICLELQEPVPTLNIIFTVILDTIFM